MRFNIKFNRMNWIEGVSSFRSNAKVRSIDSHSPEQKTIFIKTATRKPIVGWDSWGASRLWGKCRVRPLQPPPVVPIYFPMGSHDKLQMHSLPWSIFASRIQLEMEFSFLSFLFAQLFVPSAQFITNRIWTGHCCDAMPLIPMAINNTTINTSLIYNAFSITS